MTIIWITLVLVFLLSFMSRYYAVPDFASPISIRPSKLLACGVAIILVMVSGLRNNIGDTFFYMHAYKVNDFSWAAILQQKDLGFNIFQKMLKLYTDDPQILIFITALVTNILIVKILYQYSRMFDIAIYVYITSGAIIVSMNGVRQYLSAAIVLAATKYIFEGSWKKYMLVVLFASIFHQSALIMIPIYFLVRRKAWTGTTIALLCLAVALIMGYQQFSEILFSALKDTQYGDYQTFSEGGANIIRVMFYSIPLVLAFLGRFKLHKLYPNIDVIVNLSLIGFVLMVISTQNWIFARLAIYFTLYQILLTAWIIKGFRKQDQKLVYYAILLIYTIYFFYENVLILDIQYQSDYLIWPF